MDVNCSLSFYFVADKNILKNSTNYCFLWYKYGVLDISDLSEIEI